MKLAKKCSTYLVICLGKVLHARSNLPSFECQLEIRSTPARYFLVHVCGRSIVHVWDFNALWCTDASVWFHRCGVLITQLQQLETLTMSNWAKCASHNQAQENSTKMCAYQCDSDKHCVYSLLPHHLVCLTLGRGESVSSEGNLFGLKGIPNKTYNLAGSE